MARRRPSSVPASVGTSLPELPDERAPLASLRALASAWESTCEALVAAFWTRAERHGWWVDAETGTARSLAQSVDLLRDRAVADPTRRALAVAVDTVGATLLRTSGWRTVPGANTATGAEWRAPGASTSQPFEVAVGLALRAVEATHAAAPDAVPDRVVAHAPNVGRGAGTGEVTP